MTGVGWVEATAYLPRGRVGGRRRAGPDEDPFTLAATVLERLAETVPEGTEAATVWLLGAAASGRDELLAALFDRVPRFERPAHDDLAATLRAAASRPAEIHLVVTATVDPDSPAATPGDAAAGFLYRPGSDGGPLDPGTAPSGSSVGDAWALYAQSAAAPPAGVRWTGDWDAGPGSALAVDRSGLRRPADSLTFAVSEGAYVPRARYLEGLPSRWRLRAVSCGACGTTTFPAREVCRGCGARTGLSPVSLPRDGGVVLAVTEIGKGGQPTEFDYWVDRVGPYGVALVELVPGVRATLQIADAPAGSVRIGDRVGTRLRRLYPMEGEWRYGRKAVPLPA